jgi:arylamine N-acetyltransferase
MAPGPVYSPEEVNAYLDRIKVPAKTRTYLKTPGGGEHALEVLTTLQHSALTSIPFDNTVLHYSSSQELVLDKKRLFEKIVLNNEGGSCFQANRLFMWMLQSMGFHCYPTIARINRNTWSNGAAGAVDSLFGEWIHMMMIVKVHGTRYIVDTSYTSNMPTSPLIIRDNYVEKDTPFRERRLVWKNISQNTDPDQRYWVLQLRPVVAQGEKAHPWMDAYCFRTDECLLLDIDTLQRSNRHGRQSIFMSKILAYRWLGGADGSPCGSYLMWENQVRMTWAGKTTLVETLYCEDDRIAALEKYFDIKISPDNAAHTIDTVSFLKTTKRKAPKPAAQKPQAQPKEQIQARL